MTFVFNNQKRINQTDDLSTCSNNLSPYERLEENISINKANFKVVSLNIM